MKVLGLNVLEYYLALWKFSDGPAGEESTYDAEDTGDLSSIPGLKRAPGEGKWQPTPVFLPEKSHEQRSLSSVGSQKSQTRLSDYISSIIHII